MNAISTAWWDTDMYRRSGVEFSPSHHLSLCVSVTVVLVPWMVAKYFPNLEVSNTSWPLHEVVWISHTEQSSSHNLSWTRLHFRVFCCSHCVCLSLSFSLPGRLLSDTFYGSVLSALCFGLNPVFTLWSRLLLNFVPLWYVFRVLFILLYLHDILFIVTLICFFCHSPEFSIDLSC